MESKDLSFLSPWLNPQYGEVRPETMTETLDTQLGMKSAPDDIRRIILQKHLFAWGNDYYSTRLNAANDFSIIVASNYGFKNDITKIEGLLGPDPEDENVYYSWQSGLTKVVDYFLLTSKGLISVYDLINEITGKDVVIYFYDPSEASGESARVSRLKRDNGQEYYAVFIHNPKTLGDILSLIHEFGHILANATQIQIYQNMLNDLSKDPDWIEAATQYNKTIETWGDREPTEEEIQELYKKFYASIGFLKRQEIEMVIEADAWSCAIELIERIGLSGSLKPNSRDFTDYMLWAIKTRLPVTSVPHQ